MKASVRVVVGQDGIDFGGGEWLRLTPCELLVATVCARVADLLRNFHPLCLCLHGEGIMGAISTARVTVASSRSREFRRGGVGCTRARRVSHMGGSLRVFLVVAAVLGRAR